MKRLRVTITEREKLISSFNLFNFREEIVNFMYKKTVANSSRNSMVFYVLVFFLSIKIDDKSLLRDLFDKNIGKLESFNKFLSEKKKLKKGEYRSLVEKAELQNVLSYDIFFLLISAVLHSKDLFSEFSDFFIANPDVSKEFRGIVQTYEGKLKTFESRFVKNLIIDERWDENGEFHDLSKSVNRTVKMRTSRRLDMTLHKHAEVKNISSTSPVIVEIIQHINPDIIIQIWETYKIDEYVKNIWEIVNNNWVSGVILIYAEPWLRWKNIDGSKNRKEKELAKEKFKEAKEKSVNLKQQDSLIDALARSVMNSNEFLLAEIKTLKAQKSQLEKDSSVLINKEKEIAELRDRIEKLENIDIKIEEIKK